MMEFIFGGVLVCVFFLVGIYFILDDIRDELKKRNEVRDDKA